MNRTMAASTIRMGLGLITVAMLFTSCSRQEPATTVRVATERTSPAPARTPKPGSIDIAPTPFKFVGEMWIGKTSYFAVQDTERHTNAWYRAHDKIGDYEIVGLKDSALLLQSASRAVLLPLNGVRITQDENAVPPTTVPTMAEPPPTITMYIDGKRVEGTPSQLSPEQLKQFNDSKEALLKVRDKVSPDIAPMVDQALDSNTVIVSGKDGLKRSDFPPEMAAKLDDETLAKINAAIKSHAKNPPSVEPTPKN